MNPMRAPILAPLSGRNVWNTFPEVKTPGGRDRVLAIRGARGRAPSPPGGAENQTSALR
jgi:hypothetical protein